MDIPLISELDLWMVRLVTIVKRVKKFCLPIVNNVRRIVITDSEKILNQHLDVCIHQLRGVLIYSADAISAICVRN